MRTTPIEVRPVEDEAAAELSLRLHNETLPDLAASLEEVRWYKEGVDCFEVVAWLGDEPAGSALVVIEPQRREGKVALATLTVPPRFRRRGVGDALYRAVSAWAARHGRTALESWVDDSDPDGRAFAVARGFVEVAHQSRVALALASLEPAPVEAPAGIEILAWAERPELARGLYEVARECYPDIPGEEHGALPPFEEWLRHDMGGPADRPEATFVALAGAEVVGYAKLHLSAARPAVAMHDLTGVKRSWRGKGIAGALKRAQIAWAKAHGYERIETANELRNEPIRRLNERLGYRELSTCSLLRGPLAGEPGSATSARAS